MRLEYSIFLRHLSRIVPYFGKIFSKLYVYIEKMNLQQISQLLNIDFSEMKLQSGFNKLSKNQYYIIPDFFIVKLSNNGWLSASAGGPSGGKWMIVCNHQQVINLLQQHIWHFHNQGYAGTNIGGKIKLFHQLYIRYGQGLVIDHINHLKTDNRFDNLKVCTYKQNSRNFKKKSRNGNNWRMCTDVWNN